MFGRCIKVEEKVFHDTNVEVPIISLSAGHVTGKSNIWKNMTYYNNKKKRFVNNIERRGMKYSMRVRGTDRILLTLHTNLKKLVK